MTLEIIAAIDKKNGLGKDGGMAWHIKNDIRHFREITSSRYIGQLPNMVIMGRVTWESIPAAFRPLADRVNVVISRRGDFSPDGCIVVNSPEQALELAKSMAHECGTVFVIGGGQIYKEMLPYAKKLHITKVHADTGCDVFFPPIGYKFRRCDRSRTHTENGIKYHFETFVNSIF
jgi:dihydrofolate reductase